MSFDIIFCMSSNYVFGNQSKLPFPRYEKVGYWFDRHTKDKICLSGSKTFISHGAVPDEINITLTKLPDKIPPEDGAEILSGDTGDILFKLKKEFRDKDIICVGGAETINNIIPFAHNIYLCKIDQVVDGDLVISSPLMTFIQTTFTLKNVETCIETTEHPKIEFYHYQRMVH